MSTQLKRVTTDSNLYQPHYTEIDIGTEIAQFTGQLNAHLKVLRARSQCKLQITGYDVFMLQSLGYSINLRTGVCTRETKRSTLADKLPHIIEIDAQLREAGWGDQLTRSIATATSRLQAAEQGCIDALVGQLQQMHAEATADVNGDTTDLDGKPIELNEADRTNASHEAELIADAIALLQGKAHTAADGKTCHE